MRRHGKERPTVRHGWVVAGPTTLGAVLAGLGATLGLSAQQWVTGALLGLAVTAAVVRDGPHSLRPLSPADLVTLGRSMLACCVAALALGTRTDAATTRALVVVAAVALALDLVDGRVARLTRTTRFGGRFDGEADAFLILVLSVHVAASGPGWVLLIGAARYLFGAAGLWWGWLAAPLPFRYWRKVVTATQGIVLVVASAGVLPTTVTAVALLVALVLLAESFGRDVVWSWRHRSTGSVPTEGGDPVALLVPADTPARVVVGERG
jgi:phosphatidylglycerophosphate synthase